MAVTIDVGAVIQDLRIQQTTGSVLRVGRLLEAAKAAVELYAPGAPEAVANNAASMLVAFLHDSAPAEHEYAAQASALNQSGAKSLLAPYRRRVLHVLEG